MIRKSVVALAIFGLGVTGALAVPIDQSIIQVMHLESAKNSVQLADSDFTEQVSQNLVASLTRSLDHHTDFKVFGKAAKWKKLQGMKNSSEAGVSIFRVGISTDRFVQGSLSVEGLKSASVYLDGEVVMGDKKYELTLSNADHRLLVITSATIDWTQVNLDWSSEQTDQVNFTADQNKMRLNAQQLFDSETVEDIQLSPDGEVLFWSKKRFSTANKDEAIRISELISTSTNQVIYRWQAMSPGLLSWNADSSTIAFTHENSVYLLNREQLSISTLASNIEGINSLNWYDDNTLIFSWNKDEKKPHEFTKRYRGLEDRWSYWRGQSQLYQLDITSGFIQQLTKNNLGSDFVDFDNTNKKLLFTRSPIDYQQPSHVITHLFELDLSTNEEKILGQFRSFNSAAYWSDGILFSASPDVKNGDGSNLAQGIPANEYDAQLYLLKNNGEIVALSKTFKPSINSFTVLQNNHLIVAATVGDKNQLFEFNAKNNSFKLIATSIEAIESFSVSKERKARLVYKGSNATSPQKTYFKQLAKSGEKLLLNTAQQSYSNTRFSEMQDWDFVTTKGNHIDGRYYLPPDFNPEKKYPTLVYYYGGTSPVGRAFTGRWPFSLWAANGYVVYVLQPSGAVGYGQAFSAKHVNAWGIETADDILESTEAFVKAHPFVDGDKLGNLGASYGGFMTMYLATKTKLFSASISHAGISNLTSYWGHGWWGYAYSGVATRGSFPWNKADFYTQQSPVFNADKVSTPLLLLHGDADTNVPVGESHQMYTALKLLGKEVELIEFQGDNHHINGRSHRLRWWDTMLAYFDKELKDQPQWWDQLYPAKK